MSVIVGASGVGVNLAVHVTRSTAWMADWSCFMDVPEYHDPEVAICCGYGNIPLPPGALSILALVPEALAAFDHQQLLGRSWRGSRPVVVGERLEVTVSMKDGRVTGDFTSSAGETVAREVLFVADQPLDVARGLSVFVTGPLATTRIRALTASVAQLQEENPWSWSAPPPRLTELCWRVLAPSLVAGRAIGTSAQAAHRIRQIDICAAPSVFEPGSTLTAERVGSGPGWSDLSILASGAVIARATVHSEV